MRRSLIGATVGVVILGILGGAAAFWLREVYRAPGPAPSAVVVVVPRGSGLSAIAAELCKAHVITSRFVFVVGTTLAGAAHRLEAGEYRFPAHVSPDHAMRLMVEGQTVVHRLTIPEGLTTPEVMALIAKAPALSGPLPSAPPEGVLRPQTYDYSLGTTRTAMIARLEQAMKKEVAKLWADRAPGLQLKTPEQAVILASMIEKETALPVERPLVAGVFYNRLRRDMPLQSDPTVIFALTKGKGPLGRPLSDADLATPSPYNTYRVRGLPPGPIDNPGQASLIAALHPDTTHDLYFVANGKGGHVFAKTLAGQLRNVARWRKIEDANAENMEPKPGLRPKRAEMLDTAVPEPLESPMVAPPKPLPFPDAITPPQTTRKKARKK